MSLRSQQGSGMQQRMGPGHGSAPSDSGFSGISNYKAPPSSSQQQPPSRPQDPSNASTPSAASPNSSYGGKAAPISLEQSRQIARTHFDALKRWLTRENALGNGTASRNTAREKLTRLTRQQFQELSTDVYDELLRRIDDASGRPEPFLPVRNDFHPKRNQARQKLATLAHQRFRDLASDVFFELDRRYPEFSEDPEPEQAPDSDREQQDKYSQQSPQNGASRGPPPALSNSGSINSRRIPTPTGVGSAGNEVVVPNKSTLVMEDSGPHGGSNNDDGRNGYGSRRDVQSVGSDLAYSGAKTNSYAQSQPDRHYEDLSSPQQPSQQGQGSRGMRDNTSRVSETSSVGTRFIGNYAGSAPASEAGGNRKTWDLEEKEKIKADYEYKITMLQNRVTELQRENDEHRNDLMGRDGDASRMRELEQQVQTHRERYEDQSSTLQQLRNELDDLHSNRSRNAGNDDSSRLAQERAEAEDLSNELRGEVSSLVDELRSVNAKYEELLETRENDLKERAGLEEESKSWRKKYEQAKTELRNVRATSQIFSADIKIQPDHMPASSDGLISDVNVTAFQSSIDDLLQAGRAKEIASVLPAMRAVVNAVDKIDREVQNVDQRRISSLPFVEQERLQSAKSNTNATLSNLMTAAKNHATSFGVSPVSLLDAAASHLSSAVIELVRILKIRRAEPSTGSRVEPIREEERDESPPPLPPNKSNGYGGEHRSPPAQSIHSVEYTNPASRSRSGSLRDRDNVEQHRDEQLQRPRYHGATPSFGSVSSYGGGGGGGSGSGGPQQGGSYGQRGEQGGDRSPYEDRYQGVNNPTQSMYSSSSYMSPNAQQEEQPADSWEELKNYLENQTEAIVHSIQSLLSAIRSGAQAEQLNENLTRIITIVSSIVAISKDSLPEPSRAEGEAILRDLTDHCDKLSGMSQQSSGTVFDKQTKQTMASASFGVAKSLKALNALLDSYSNNNSLM